MNRQRFAFSSNLRCSSWLRASALCLLLTAVAAADDEAEMDEPVSATRAARVAAMRQRAASLTAKFRTGEDGFREAELVEPPLLSYNNVTNLEIDATLWAWGRRGRPIAVAAIHQDRGLRNYWSCEMVSFADRSISIAGKPGWVWSPAKSGIEWKPVPDAPGPGKTAVGRSAQIKHIASRFSSTGYYRNGNVIELRLMGRPLHRYADPDVGLIGGALLAFAEGTNPETLLLIECRGAEGQEPVWHYGLARMSGGRLVARLDDKVVWECPDILGYDPERPYSSYNGPESLVFGDFSDSEKTKE